MEEKDDNAARYNSGHAIGLFGRIWHARVALHGAQGYLRGINITPPTDRHRQPSQISGNIAKGK